MPKNRAVLETEHISRKTTQNIYRAFDYAKFRGIPFNLYIVLHLHEAESQIAATIFERVRHKYRDWLAYQAKRFGHRLPPLYVYTFEAPDNPHVNWVLRVPPFLVDQFLEKLPKWVAKVQGPIGPYDLNVSSVEPDKGYKSLANYMVKGCDPAFIEHFHLQALHDQHGAQGTFWGRRAGVCPALNKTARDTAGYDDKKRKLKSALTIVPPSKPKVEAA